MRIMLRYLATFICKYVGLYDDNINTRYIIDGHGTAHSHRIAIVIWDKTGGVVDVMTAVAIQGSAEP